MLYVADKGVADLSGFGRVTLDGGNINAPKVKGHLKVLDVISKQDQFSSKQKGGSLNFSANIVEGAMQNPTGGFSFHQASTHGKAVKQRSGIIARNGSDKSFSIKQLNVIDTKLDPLLAAQAKHVNFTKIGDESKSDSFGLGMQGLDLSVETDLHETYAITQPCS